jgi:hypothetical protein
MKWVLAAFGLISLNALAAEAALQIVTDKARLSFSQSQLLSRRDLQTLSITDSEYKQRFTQFKAISMANLLTGLAIPELAVIQITSLELCPQGIESLSGDRRSQQPLAAARRKNSFGGSVLPALDESPGIRDRTRGMALRDRLNPCSVRRTQRVSQHFPRRQRHAECSKRIQVLREELLCVPQNERQWDGVGRAGFKSSQESHRVFCSQGAYRAHSKSRKRAHLAGNGHAGILGGGDFRSRTRGSHRIPRVHEYTQSQTMMHKSFAKDNGAA